MFHPQVTSREKGGVRGHWTLRKHSTSLEGERERVSEGRRGGWGGGGTLIVSYFLPYGHLICRFIFFVDSHPHFIQIFQVFVVLPNKGLCRTEES